MADELYVSFTIPAEYVRQGEDGMILNMPTTYAASLTKAIRYACACALAEETTKNMSDADVRSLLISQLARENMPLWQA